jgi:hypothetical protein
MSMQPVQFKMKPQNIEQISDTDLERFRKVAINTGNREVCLAIDSEKDRRKGAKS